MSSKALPRDGKSQEPQYACLYQDTELSISSLIGKVKSMTGPFVSLYSSVFQFADLKGYQHL